MTPHRDPTKVTYSHAITVKKIFDQSDPTTTPVPVNRGTNIIVEVEVTATPSFTRCERVYVRCVLLLPNGTPAQGSPFDSPLFDPPGSGQAIPNRMVTVTIPTNVVWTSGNCTLSVYLFKEATTENRAEPATGFQLGIKT